MPNHFSGKPLNRQVIQLMPIKLQMDRLRQWGHTCIRSHFHTWKTWIPSPSAIWRCMYTSRFLWISTEYPNLGGGGVTHIYKLYEYVPSKWVVFSQEILRHGSIFQKKNPLDMGPFFQNVQKFGCLPCHPKFLKFSGVCHVNTQKFCKIGLYFGNGYRFLGKNTLTKTGKGFEAQAAHPRPNQIWVPPPPPDPNALLLHRYSFTEVLV